MASNSRPLKRGPLLPGLAMPDSPSCGLPLTSRPVDGTLPGRDRATTWPPSAKGAWAEVLRHEGITDVEDLVDLERALWKWRDHCQRRRPIWAGNYTDGRRGLVPGLSGRISRSASERTGWADHHHLPLSSREPLSGWCESRGRRPHRWAHRVLCGGSLRLARPWSRCQ